MASAVKPVAAGLVTLLIVAVPRAALAQECPKPDPVAQKAKEQECLAAGDEWGKFGAIAHLCGIYGCAPRTKDGGKPCRNRAECEYLCVYPLGAALWAQVTGECAAVGTRFGCTTQVDGGRVVRDGMHRLRCPRPIEESRKGGENRANACPASRAPGEPVNRRRAASC